MKCIKKLNEEQINAMHELLNTHYDEVRVLFAEDYRRGVVLGACHGVLVSSVAALLVFRIIKRSTKNHEEEKTES